MDHEMESSSVISGSQALNVPVHVEVCIKDSCSENHHDLEERVREYIQQTYESFEDGPISFETNAYLKHNVRSIHLCDVELSSSEGIVSADLAELIVHIFQLDADGGVDEEADDADGVSACQQWVLPSKEFHGLWENLIYDSNVKSELLEYAATALLFSECNVDPNVIAWNRVVLLHGPPGTGKTSLCKALAQKLAIRFSHRYTQGMLLEINSHSLFSRWFSESGKLVQKLFAKIGEQVEDEDSLVCVLIDEVESLTAARKAAIAGSEPSDAIRSVNALLTQIDKLREKPNVLIITTSNITEAIDLAFVDRADIKQFIGPPSEFARYEILRSCINELMRVGIVQAAEPLGAHKHFKRGQVTPQMNSLMQVAVQCEGLSGRTLRKLPFIAHAMFVSSIMTPLESYLVALNNAVAKEKASRAMMETA